MSTMPEQSLINTEALRQLIREELRAMQNEDSKPAEKKDGDEELTVKEVAQMKGVKPRTVYDWVRENRIPHHYTPGGRLRFYRRHAERVLSESPRP
ncbi:MAG: helix-turn-helix domain-containing protein [Pyrinomonadaceae bacterium]